MSLARFDWYEATLSGLDLGGRLSVLHENVHLLARSVLQKCFDDPFFSADADNHGWRLDDYQFEYGRGFNHYRFSLAVYSPVHVPICRFLYNEESSVHCIASGKNSPLVSDVIRTICPNHSVTRVDSALDFLVVGDWERLVKLCNDLRDGDLLGRRLTTTTIMQDAETAGKTFYVGSMKSESFLRIYDKTREQKHSLPKHLHSEIADNWTRAEVVFRPTDKGQRLYLSKASPADIWASSPTFNEFYRACVGGELGHLPEKEIRVPDADKAYWTALYQYRRSWERVLNQCGGDMHKFGEKVINDLMTANLL